MTKRHVGVLLNGGTVTATTRRGLMQMAKRRRTVVVDSWTTDDAPPFNSSDARDWDDYRNRHGYAGGH